MKEKSILVSKPHVLLSTGAASTSTLLSALYNLLLKQALFRLFH